jgi:type I restriction enzyme S subunit
MTICDQLEASMSSAAEIRRHLLDALLGEALAPENISVKEAAE